MKDIKYQNLNINKQFRIKIQTNPYLNGRGTEIKILMHEAWPSTDESDSYYVASVCERDENIKEYISTSLHKIINQILITFFKK